jgi:putative ABC transport system permease protein
MLLWENIHLAITSLLSNKMRALLTMLGIIIGISAVIAILTLGNSLTNYISEMMQGMGANNIIVMVSPKAESEDNESKDIDGVTFPASNKSALKDIGSSDLISEEMINDLVKEFPDDIYAINVYMDMNSSISYGDKSTNSMVYATSVGYFVTNKLNMLAGSMFSEHNWEGNDRVIIVSDKFADKVFDGDYQGAIGKQIKSTIGDEEVELTIVGVYKFEQSSGGMSSMIGMMDSTGTMAPLYIPIKELFKVNHIEPFFVYFSIITKVGVDTDSFAKEVTKFFEPYYRQNRTYSVSAFTMGQMIKSLTDMINVIFQIISLVAAIALFVGGIGVMNIMLVSVTERTREIGTRKALGAKNSSIRTQFIVEAMIICLIGGILGVAFGLFVGFVLSNALGYPGQASLGGILVALLFSMAVGLFFGYYPANKAAKMNPIEALRYE